MQLLLPDEIPTADYLRQWAIPVTQITQMGVAYRVYHIEMIVGQFAYTKVFIVDELTQAVNPVPSLARQVRWRFG